jgi:hypothetical protein
MRWVAVSFGVDSRKWVSGRILCAVLCPGFSDKDRSPLSWRLSAKAQAVRQSTALTQNGMIAVWEVPSASEAARAHQLLNRAGATNITIRWFQNDEGSRLVVADGAVFLEFGGVPDGDVAIGRLEALAARSQLFDPDQRRELGAGLLDLSQSELEVPLMELAIWSR